MDNTVESLSVSSVKPLPRRSNGLFLAFDSDKHLRSNWVELWLNQCRWLVVVARLGNLKIYQKPACSLTANMCCKANSLPTSRFHVVCWIFPMISRLTKRSQKFVIQLHQSLLGLDQFLQSEACKLCSFEKNETPVEPTVFEDWTASSFGIQPHQGSAFHSNNYDSICQGRKWDISEAWWKTDVFFSCFFGLTQVLWCGCVCCESVLIGFLPVSHPAFQWSWATWQISNWYSEGYETSQRLHKL